MSDKTQETYFLKNITFFFVVLKIFCTFVLECRKSLSGGACMTLLVKKAFAIISRSAKSLANFNWYNKFADNM